MRLVMTMVVRNEEDVIGPNLDFHLAQGVDFVIVTDHGSTDRTPEILAGYEASGQALVIRDEEPAHDQARRVTAMARLAATEYGADWVVNNDADEFWWPQVGSLRDVLGAVPERYGKFVVSRRNFRPVAEQDGVPFFLRMTVSEVRSLSPRGLPLEPKVAHRGRSDITVLPGNHDVEPFLESVPLPGLIEILHFPIRSRAQFARKVEQTGVGYELLAGRDPSVGVDQLMLLGLQRSGKLDAYYDDQMVNELAMDPQEAEGQLVRDERLAQFMVAIGRRSPVQPRIRSEDADVMVSTALGWKVEADDLTALTYHLREQGAALEQRLRETEASLARTQDDLSQVQASRILRYTKRLRRWYYRFRPAGMRGKFGRAKIIR